MRIILQALLVVGLFILSHCLSGRALAYQEAKVENGGTIKGRVTYKGAIPMRKVIPTKDMEVCGGIREDPLIVVGSNNGVKDAVVYMSDIENGKPWGNMRIKLAVINNKDCRFHPHVQVAQKGPVEIENSDPVLHNTHGFYGKKTAFNVALPLKGMEVKQSLRQSGLVRVECDAHGWMRGWIYVVENPYYGITGEDGSFVITDVPPGEHTVLIWQEETGTMERKVTVKPNETVTLDVELKK